MVDISCLSQNKLCYFTIRLLLFGYLFSSPVETKKTKEQYILDTPTLLTTGDINKIEKGELTYLRKEHNLAIAFTKCPFIHLSLQDKSGGYHYIFGVRDSGSVTRHIEDDSNRANMVNRIRGMDGVTDFTIDEARYMYPRAAPTINDPEYSNQWHMQSTTNPSMGIYEAWSLGYSGAGITVSVTDDGIERTHTDLSGKYQAAFSYDYANGDSIPDHTGSESHGTNCAGIVAAERNTNCIIGIAYDADLAAVKILDSIVAATSSDFASTLVHSLENIDIYSNSWGPSDDGNVFSALSSIEDQMLLRGVTEGRGGKGVLYTWASGNGGQNGDDCNCDGYTNSIYTIAVASVSNTGAPTFYSEQCTAILGTTYGGDSPNPQIYTTETSDTCTSSFQGTSAATPVASGILALLLQAKSDLTWRDVQHLIVETSSFTGLNDPNGLTTNAASKSVSKYFGFGLMNANSMIARAASWVMVPTQISCTESTESPGSSGTTQLESTHAVSSCSVAYLEHVRVTIAFKGDTRGKIQFFLVSPGGTTSQILHARVNDNTAMSSFDSFTFMSVHTWGENPSGTWTLRMSSSDSSINLYLQSWQLILYGTQTDPVIAASSSSTEDSGVSTGVIVGAAVGGVVVSAGVVATIAVVLKLQAAKTATVAPI